jgi:SAM-dependent methyltransferase
MSFADHFSRVSAGYAAFRPRYPDELFSWLAGAVVDHDLAWDCATGSGQAALGLARHFTRVVATDASASQIARAVPDARVSYRVAPAEESGLADNSADLVTVAQALHWLPRERFFAEARRVLRVEGLLAVWGYHVPLTGEASIDALIRDYHDEVVGPYWPPGRELVLARFTTIDFPFDEIAPPPFAIRQRMSLAMFANYLGTQSATDYYIRAHEGRDPVPEFERRAAAIWGGTSVEREVTWPMFVRAGRPGGRSSARPTTRPCQSR